MVKLLIIADDFTGALDTGVQFAARGAATRVVTDLAYDFTLADAEVLVMVAETRHLPPEEAYDVVYRTARNAREAGIPYIYKKTDSALRGNIGSELTAVMDAAGSDTIAFLPAFPKMGRDPEWCPLCGRCSRGGECVRKRPFRASEGLRGGADRRRADRGTGSPPPSG